MRSHWVRLSLHPTTGVLIRSHREGFPGDPVVKNPPADVGDMDSFSDRGTENPQAVEQPTLGATATEPVLRSKRSRPQ